MRAFKQVKMLVKTIDWSIFTEPAFAGGRLTSDGGVMLLAAAERLSVQDVRFHVAPSAHVPPMVSRGTSAHMIRPARELPTGKPVYLFQQGIIVSPGRSLGPLQSIDQVPLRYLILGREETRPMTQFTAYTTDTAPEAARPIFGLCPMAWCRSWIGC